MNFDQLGQTWRDENGASAADDRLERCVATTRVAERFSARVFQRDLIETIACLFVVYAFGSQLLDLGDRFALPRVAAMGMVTNILGALYVMYRLHRTRLSTPTPRLDVSMREYCDSEIERIAKQIALLRSVHLWYLSPFYAGVTLIFFAIDGLCVEFVGITVLVTVLFFFLYRLNRFVAATAMTDLRDQLVGLRASLGSESAPIDALPEPPDRTRETRRFVIRWFSILVGVGVVGFFVALLTDVQYPKQAPYDAIRWRQEAPEVLIADEWLRLRSIDDVPTDEIVRFCKRTYYAKWRKRFEEDLVEALTKMGHPPGDTVRLVVSRPGSNDGVVLEGVPMSEEKRQAD